MINIRVKELLCATFVVLGAITTSTAQKKQKPLLTIAETPVYPKEFKRVYLKNLDLVKDESQKNVDEYLKLFIDYKLKIKSAIANGLDKKKSYIDELAGYRQQLAGSYLTDTNVTDDLVKEAFEHQQESVNASHILIQMKSGATPADTLKAYNKIQEARARIVKGEDFGVVAKEYSEDPSAAENSGDLGWFSAFRMVYPFEKAAFDTKVGAVSEPFKTQFGYHILKVNDRRKASGQITTAHIMLAVTSADTITAVKEKINDIYTQLEKGAEFETLASQFSEDRFTAAKGGVLKKFAMGDLNAPAFEKAAFALEKPNSYSKPVKSNFGWHIIKLIEKHKPDTFDEVKAELAEKIKRDSRSKLITNAFIEKIKKQYGVTDVSATVVDFFKDKIKVGDSLAGLSFVGEAYEAPLMKIKDSTYTYAKFGGFLKKGNLNKRIEDVDGYVKQAYQKYVSQTLLSYYEANLERDNEDFAVVMTEYRDGLLLFDLMENKIWNTAKTDSVGLQKYFEANSANYLSKERYKIQKVSTEKKEIADQIKSLWDAGSSVEEIKEKINAEASSNAIFTEEIYAKGDKVLPEGFVVEKEKVQFFEKEGYYTILEVTDVLPAGPQKLEETKGRVINDYQKDLEASWLKELRAKYPVVVNKKTLKKVKKELQK